MKGIFNIVLKEEIDLDNLKIKTEPMSVSQHIAYHKEGLEINGNLDLDYFSDDYIAEGLYVDGDLIVHGNIFGGIVAFIYVGGDLHVDSLFATDAEELKITVQGNLYVKHFLITNEDNPHMDVKGDVHSTIRIHSPHLYYIKLKNQIDNTICFTHEDFPDIWNDLIYEKENWRNFVVANNGDDCDCDIGCSIDFVRKYWYFYKALWKKQNVFPIEILEDFTDDYFNEKVNKKTDTSEILSIILAYIEEIRNSKPSDKYCEDY